MKERPRGLRKTPAERQARHKRNLELILRHQNGERGPLNTLVLENLGLVRALERASPFRGHLHRDDRLQEACIGMVKAAGRFEARHGTSLSTYAAYCIRHAVRHASTEQSERRCFRVPARAWSQIQELKRRIGRFEREHGRAVKNDGELCAYLLGSTDPYDLTTEDGIRKRIRHLSALMEQTCFSAQAELSPNERHDAFRGMATYPFTEEDAYDENPDDENVHPSTFDEVLCHPDEDPETTCALRELVKARSALLGRMLSSFASVYGVGSPVERLVLALRFNLVGPEIPTLKAIGDCIGLSKERIRQLQEQGLKAFAKYTGLTAEAVALLLAGAHELCETLDAPELLESLQVPGDWTTVERLLVRPEPTIDVREGFSLICEHLLALPNGSRIVQVPNRILMARTGMSEKSVDRLLGQMVDERLISDSVTWSVVHVIPNVPLPVHPEYPSTADDAGQEDP